MADGRDASTTPQRYKIFCIVEGDENAFSVDIEETVTVADLKEETVKKNSELAKVYPLHKLKLYKINVNASTRQKLIEEVESLKLDASKELVERHKLSALCAPSGPSDETVHILVRIPPGESKDPKVGSAFAETNVVYTLSPQQLLRAAKIS